MEQQRGLLLLFLGVQLLLVGMFLYQNHRGQGFNSFLRFLLQAKSEEAEGLPFLAQVASAGLPSWDVYSNLSQIHPMDLSDEDLPNCPAISPYISKLAGASYAPSPTLGFGELAVIPEERGRTGEQKAEGLVARGEGACAGYRWLHVSGVPPDLVSIMSH